MSEAVLSILIGALLVAIVVASSGYYRRIRQAQGEYEKARSVIEDIVLSFNRELRQKSERLEQVAFKVEGSLAKSDTGLRRIDIIEKRFLPIESQLNDIETQKKVFDDHWSIIENQKSLLESQINQLNSIVQNNSSLTSALSCLDVKIKDLEAMQEFLKDRMNVFEEQVQKVLLSPQEIKIEQVMPVVPIKRDKALASLTNTEVVVLEMLSSEGPKTAPEIKDRVYLSREHTARLMKKLYEDGYLEREMGKIPFKYSIKKEMEKFLKKEDLSVPET